MEPDVKVIVGGQTFHHYAALLCNCSDYFDAMLSSNMKEGQTNVIEFVDKDPQEWKRVYDFIGDPSNAQLELETIPMLVPWFSELRLSGWLRRCDKVLDIGIHEERNEFDSLQAKKATVGSKRVEATAIINRILDHVQVSVAFHLASSMEEGLSFLDNIFLKYIYYLDPETIGRIIQLLKHEAAWTRLWPRVRMHLPSKVRDFEPENLLDNPLLEEVIHQKSELVYMEEHCDDEDVIGHRYY